MTTTSRRLTTGAATVRAAIFAAAVFAAVFLSTIDTVASMQANRVDVTGVWVFTVESPAGKSNPVLTFKQDGEKLTGQYSSQLMGQADLTGTVKGEAIEFVVSATVQARRSS
jgi:hypothetical protein